MTIDREYFFSGVREHLFHNDINQSQVDGCNEILDVWDQSYETNPLSYLAYCLATAFHETARTMRPIEEIGHGKGHPYAIGGWFGRGLVQISWESNYKRASAMLAKIGIHADLVADKEKALDPTVASNIMFEGMLSGLFTGKKLADYIPHDPADARRIINGLDCAAEIAGYYQHFLAALRLEPVKPSTEGAPSK